MYFERPLRHYHPQLFLCVRLSSKNVFPQPVSDDMGHVSDTAHAEERLRTWEGTCMLLS